MNKQTKQLLALGFLLVAWAISWKVNRIPIGATAAAMKAKAAKSAQQENLLSMRFHKLRAQMDGLYHYRIKPVPFDAKENPFRLPSFMEEASVDKEVPSIVAKGPVIEAGPPTPEAPAESGETLLKHAIGVMRLGGVVTMNNNSQLNVNGELRKEGDVFTVTVKGKLVLIRIKHLTTTYVILALDDPAAGTAEARVRLN
jgi:hypothetical protein